MKTAMAKGETPLSHLVWHTLDSTVVIYAWHFPGWDLMMISE